MTTSTGRAAVLKVIGLINGQTGVNSLLAEGTQRGGATASPLNAAQVRAQNVSVEIAERSNAIQYPAANVYCEKIVNDLTEKFCSFSGNVQLAVELRHSSDRLEGLQDGLEGYADAVMQVLDSNRGDWGNGMFFGGEYQASFAPVKHGGRNFVQTVKITFEIGVSRR
jgi:hypothetical protein